MKLLIVTQVVDRDDPILGFFHRWIEEFAKHCGSVEVICLKEGKHTLPQNVHVHSLGKEHGRPLLGALTYAVRFKWLAWSLRKKYDTVFVHMNPEYIALYGPLWKILGKRVALWYTHKNVDLKLRIAAFFADVIFTASKESFRLESKKVRIMGHGIDTDFFTPDPNVVRGTALLSVGRLMPSKRHDLGIRAAAIAGRDLRIVGSGSERQSLEALAHEVNAHVAFVGGLTQAPLRDEYRKAGVFVHTSETGSLDKVVLEALACGLPVITTSTVLQDLPVIHAPATAEGLAQAVLATQVTDGAQPVAYVRTHHALAPLIENIVRILSV